MLDGELQGRVNSLPLYVESCHPGRRRQNDGSSTGIARMSSHQQLPQQRDDKRLPNSSPTGNEHAQRVWLLPISHRADMGL
jgi:hypothetical protein